jgi:hypothetical protein
MPDAAGSLFDDLDAALQRGSSEKRVAMLRQVTDLFLSEADRLNEEQIAVFDDVPVQLIERIETRTLAQISERLAPVAHAPIDVPEDLLISCKVADCKWETVSAVLATKLPPGSAPKAGREKLKIDFAKFSKPNPQRLLRFWQVREVSARSA